MSSEVRARWLRARGRSARDSPSTRSSDRAKSRSRTIAWRDRRRAARTRARLARRRPDRRHRPRGRRRRRPGVKKFELGVRVYDAQYGALRTSAYRGSTSRRRTGPCASTRKSATTSPPPRQVLVGRRRARRRVDDAGVGETETANLLGQNQTYIFRGPGTTCTLWLTAEFENEVRSATRFAVMCKYVRRGCRHVAADREAFFTGSRSRTARTTSSRAATRTARASRRSRRSSRSTSTRRRSTRARRSSTG